MAKQFWVWKDRNCNGENPEWLSLTGEEFYEFIQKEENKGRCFVKLSSLDDEDDTIIIESTKEKYDEAEKERKRADYVCEGMMNHETVSVYTYADEDDASVYEKIASDEISVENAIEHVMMLGKLHDALKRLTPEEAELINLYYFTEGATERSVAAILGVSRKTVAYRRDKIIEFLKSFFAQN